MPPLVSVIIPGFNASAMLRQSLASVRAQDWPKECLELIYADDGSTDDSVDVASALADRVVLSSGTRKGPAAARNAGVRESSGEILVFLDADVIAPPGTVRALATALLENEDLDAVFGSYDSEPLDSKLVSQYRNLLHHFVHQTSRQDASTFWAGCGAIRRRSFEAVGGFDSVRYRGAMIEDIELGHRMQAKGMRIRLQPEIQVKHLKCWTLPQMIHADVFSRGIPWMRLLFQDSRASGEIGDLNLKLSGVISIVLTWLAAVLTAVSLYDPKHLIPVSLLAVIGFLINLRTFRFFWRVRGLGFAVKVIPFHVLYHLYNGASVIGGLFCHLFIDRRQSSYRRIQLP